MYPQKLTVSYKPETKPEHFETSQKNMGLFTSVTDLHQKLKVNFELNIDLTCNIHLHFYLYIFIVVGLRLASLQNRNMLLICKQAGLFTNKALLIECKKYIFYSLGKIQIKTY
jgi:hypothetical protein